MLFNKFRLEDITDKIGDGIHGTPEYDENGEFNLVNGNNRVDGDIVFKNDTKKINKEQYVKNKRDLNNNTLLVSINGTLGNVAKYKNEKIILGKSACYINVKYEFNVDYVYFVFVSPAFKKYLQYGANGTTIKNVPLSAIRNYEISIPSKENQDKIVKILKTIEDKIKLNNKINNNLYEMGDNLYNEYFGKYKDNLPSDYKIVKLNEVADNYDSKRKPMSSREREQHKGIYPYYGATSIIDYVDNYIFDDTYLLMGEDGTVKTDDGYPVLQYIWGKNWINNHAHVLKGKKISTELLMFALRKINIENIITGAVQPKINQENMNKIEFIIGSDSKNKELEVILKNLMDKSKKIIEENERLEQLRDTLLPKLMNGEIDLDNIGI